MPIMLGFLVSGLSKDKGQRGVSILHMAALETVAFAVDEQWLEDDVSPFSDKDDQKQRQKATKTLHEKLEDLPMSYLQWGVHLI